MKRYFNVFILITTLLFAGFLTACGATEADPTSLPSPPTPTLVPAATISAPETNPTPVDESAASGQVFVESIVITILESMPVQVDVTISGNLSDGCTEITGTEVVRTDNRFEINIETFRDPDLLCTQALVPFTEKVSLDTIGLPAGTYTVVAGDSSETFTLTAANAPQPTPDLSEATLTVAEADLVPGETASLSGSGYPAGSIVEIGIGRVNSEYDIIGSTQIGEDGNLNAQISVPDFVEPEDDWVFVADLNHAKVVSAPLMIMPADTPAPTPTAESESDAGMFTRTQIFLIAIDDGGENGEMIGCNDSAIPVTVEIEPTIAPLTAALERMLTGDEQFFGQSGLYNVFYQSDLSVAGVDIDGETAVIHLTGDLVLGGVCDNPRVKAQLEQTALQYATISDVSISINGEPLDDLLSGE